MKAIKEFFYYGNYFYGFCVVALAVESSIKLHYPLNIFWFYLLLFAATIAYYTKAYITELNGNTNNPRTNWYIKNKHIVKCSQFVIVIFSIIIAGLLAYKNVKFIIGISLHNIIICLLFPVTAFYYYGVNSKFSLRNIGFLKPYVIGFTWAGIVTIYPVMFYKLTHAESQQINFFTWLMFLQNFLFITILSIMFDIKDYEVDHNLKLKTYVVKHGLQKTIFNLIMPLCILLLVSLFIYGSFHNFSTLSLIINSMPYMLMLLVAYLLQKPKSILFYLILIDGLMIIKAICGIVANFVN